MLSPVQTVERLAVATCTAEALYHRLVLLVGRSSVSKSAPPLCLCATLWCPSCLASGLEEHLERLGVEYER